MTDRRTTAQIEADIERQRDELADTLDQLTHKLDVKAQVKARPQVVVGAVTLVVLVTAFVWWRRR
jgi:hypothetical protein